MLRSGTLRQPSTLDLQLNRPINLNLAPASSFSSSFNAADYQRQPICFFPLFLGPMSLVLGCVLFCGASPPSQPEAYFRRLYLGLSCAKNAGPDPDFHSGAQGYNWQKSLIIIEPYATIAHVAANDNFDAPRLRLLIDVDKQPSMRPPLCLASPYVSVL